jgi:hypothetical protein
MDPTARALIAAHGIEMTRFADLAEIA